MKKLFYFIIATLVIGILFQGCSVETEVTENPQQSEVQKTDDSQQTETQEIDISEKAITKEMAYEGVNNYCHSEYDWSIAEENPSIMYVQIGEESETEYQIIFHSYTGANVYFYVDKLTGTTRIVEYVPNLDIEEEAGTIELFDYLDENE